MYLYEKIKLVQDITDDTIKSMLEVMKPAVRTHNGWYREISIENTDYRNESFIWDKTLIGPEFVSNGLDEGWIPTFHTFGAPSLFKPSLAEVLSAIQLYCPDWSDVRYFVLEDNLSADSIIGMSHMSKCKLIAKPLIEDYNSRLIEMP